MISNRKFIVLFSNSLMKKGKKRRAEVFTTQLLRLLKKNYNKVPILILIQAVTNIKPLIGFRNIKSRGFSYEIPYFLKEEEQIKVAFFWLLVEAKLLSKKFISTLSKLFFQAYLNQGSLIKKRDIVYKLSNKNKVFSHYRWF